MLNNCLKKKLSYLVVPNLENTCVWLSKSCKHQTVFLAALFTNKNSLPPSFSWEKTAAFISLNNEMGLGKGKLWCNYTNLVHTAVTYSPILFLILLSPFIFCSYSHVSPFIILLFATLPKPYYRRMAWVGSDLEII